MTIIIKHYFLCNRQALNGYQRNTKHLLPFPFPPSLTLKHPLQTRPHPMRPLTLIPPIKLPNLRPIPPSRILPILLVMLPIRVVPVPDLDRAGHPAVVRVPGEGVAFRMAGAVLMAVFEGEVGGVVGRGLVEGGEVGVVPVLVEGGTGWREGGVGEEEGEEVAVEEGALGSV